MELADLFSDAKLVKKVQARLPELFHLAELQSSRSGRVGMEVGSVREKIIIALLIHKFGRANVDIEIPIVEPEVDVRVVGRPVSIKTMTGRRLLPVKLIWTVDAEKAREFGERYYPSSDILLVHVNWGQSGSLYLLRQSLQSQTLKRIGRERYIVLPKQGTNPRGVEISSEALQILIAHEQTSKITIQWNRPSLEYDPYQSWLEHWERD